MSSWDDPDFAPDSDPPANGNAAAPAATINLHFDADAFTKANAGPGTLTPQGFAMAGTGTSPDAPRVSPYAEIGSTGLVQYGGFVRDEFLPQLQGDRGLKVYREMSDNNDVVGGLLFAIDMLIRQVEWRIEPAEAASVEEIVAERAAERERARAMAIRAKQQKLSMQMPPVGPDGKPAPKGPVPGQASPTPTPGVHEALTPKPPLVAKASPVTNIHKGVWARDFKLIDKIRAALDYEAVLKAGSSRGGESIAAQSPGGIDPETHEPLSELGTYGGVPGEGGAEAPQQTPAQAEAEFWAVFVETAIHDMTYSWADTISMILADMLPMGFAVNELVYKKRAGYNPDDIDKSSHYDDGKIGWAKLAPRAAETRHRWEFDDNGRTLGMWQLAPPNYRMVYIPMHKALLFRTSTKKDNPEGHSILRTAYRAFYFIRRIEEVEAIGVERDLAGLPIAYVPYELFSVNATPEQKATLEAIKTIVTNIRRDEQEGVVFPNAYDMDSHNKLYELDLLSTGGRRQFDTNQIIARYQQGIARTVLADFILLGHQGTGSFALSKTKTDLFTTALESWLNMIADVFNTTAIPRIMKLNNVDTSLSPKLTFGKLGGIDLEGVAAFLTAMAGAGADLFPDNNLEEHLRDMVGFPPKSGSDDL